MKKNNFALPVGIIDIGSNSVRLMFTDGIFIKKNLITTRLGGGFLSDGSLSAGSMLVTVNAVKELKELALKMGAKQVFAFATAAVRRAKNQSEFIGLIRDACSFDLDVVSGDMEAKLAVLGALKAQKGAVIDVGGASTEIAFSNGESIYFKHSYNVGAVTLSAETSGCEGSIEKRLSEIIKINDNYVENNVLAIGGTATSLGAISLGLTEYDSERVHGCYISKNQLIDIKDLLYGLEPKDICKKFAIDKKRAEIIAGGASIFLSVLNAYGLNGFTVSESDNLEGYLEYLKG